MCHGCKVLCEVFQLLFQVVFVRGMLFRKLSLGVVQPTLLLLSTACLVRLVFALSLRFLLAIRQLLAYCRPFLFGRLARLKAYELLVSRLDLLVHADSLTNMMEFVNALVS